MSSLDLKIEGPEGPFGNEIFHLLRRFLQAEKAVTMESTAQSILALLPENGSLSTDVWIFGEICIELAEQIPYHHPSQLKLVGLLEDLGMSRKLGLTVPSKETSKGCCVRYQRLGESLRDNLACPDPENPSEYVNFHAFAANVFERRFFSNGPTWAIWAQRDAHEDRREEKGVIRDAYVLAAAQWILWYGQSLFKQVLFPGDAPDDLRPWTPGPLYHGKASLSLHRWHFWRDGFNAVASGQEKGGEAFGQECTSVAAKAVEIMDSLERNMTFTRFRIFHPLHN
ncbi:hypothetical protein IMSHALPRED_005160 [Imshaugia aleurites]|uniref:Uncharacterized protein n=1 Tax=Imshaugia aleurites TaxID=172621 RepID=A0A8H3IPM8_9LECA|nr:hypothetical protein IMSHALPRED_005160 [Imshaugia aleurites]